MKHHESQVYSPLRRRTRFIKVISVFFCVSTGKASLIYQRLDRRGKTVLREFIVY